MVYCTVVVLVVLLGHRSDGRRRPCVIVSLLRHLSSTLLSLPDDSATCPAVIRQLSSSTSEDSCVTY